MKNVAMDPFSEEPTMVKHGRWTLPAMVAVIAIALAGVFTAGSAEAALNAVSPGRNPGNFPLWYRDTAGPGATQLAACLGVAPDGGGLADPLCVLPTVPPLEPNYNPALPIVFPTNYPGEIFYFIADAIMPIGLGGDNAILRIALEAAFAGATPTDGEQITFLRVNLTGITGLAINSTYTVTYPYGSFTITTDGSGATIDTGNAAKRIEDPVTPVAIGIFPGAYELLLPAAGTNVSTFLRWPTGAPAGYIGDAATPHVVTGGTNGNVFTVTATAGPATLADIDPLTPGVQTTVSTALFTVAGKLFAPTISEVTPVAALTNDPTPNYTFTTNDVGTITYGGDCSSATTAAVLGNNTITFNTLLDGLHANCTITVTNAAGNASNVLNVTHFTTDTTAPVLAEATPVPNPTNDHTPNYSFSTAEAGTISYGGSCSSATTSAVVGINTITLNPVPAGLTSDCTITVTDAATNASTPLGFTVNYLNLAPVLGAVGNKLVDEGKPLAFTLAAADTAGDTMTYIATGLPAGATLNAASGAFSWKPKFNQAGSYPITFTVTDDGAPVLNDTEVITVTVNNVKVKNDFDSDGSSDIGCYFPSGGNWFEFRSTDGFFQTTFGYEGTLPVTGDFDGDGTSDIGAYYAPGGNWYLFKSTEGFSQTQFGFEGTIPIVGDFDGDGKSDIGAYHADSGSWYVFKSTEGFSQTQFGYAGTIPVVGDLDGDGRDDLAVYDPALGAWFAFKSTEGFWQTQFGFAGTIPVVGDFDGDGKADIGVYYPTGGNWYVFKSTEGFFQTTFGYEGTEPVVGDFDADGRDDLGVYFATGGNWYVFRSTDGFWQTTFGFEGTIPLGGTLR